MDSTVMSIAAREHNYEVNTLKQLEVPMENEFVGWLENLGWQKSDNKKMKENFRHNLVTNNKQVFKDLPLTNDEFDNIYLRLCNTKNGVSIETLLQPFTFDREDGSKDYVSLFDIDNWGNNIFQVMQQVQSTGAFNKNSRFDVTLLVNGIPVIQIELKQKGLDFIEAFDQIQRYKSEKQYNGLFNFLQVFVVSNGVNTRYIANTPKLDQAFLFNWADKYNNHIDNLEDFTHSFLARERVFSILRNYLIFKKENKQLLVLRPYQIHCLEETQSHLLNSNKHGFIWHNTGSGKTLTAFKLAQMANDLKDKKGKRVFDKVVIITDRIALDEQTAQEFSSFKKGSFFQATSTKDLTSALTSQDEDKRVIMTTIQKLAKSIQNVATMRKTNPLKTLFIFDECHRSQFGQFQRDIHGHFSNFRMIGFTGTPILIPNSMDGRKTQDVFETQIHQYKLVNALYDHNVLPFEVEYCNSFDLKTEITDPNGLYTGLNTTEALDHPKRQKAIAKDVLDTYHLRSSKGKYNAIFAASCIPAALSYYAHFQELNNKALKKDKLAITLICTPPTLDLENNQKVKNVVNDYNKYFQTHHTQGPAFNRDVLKNVKLGKINLLIVVDMALTGFDSKLTNQLYLDKTLQDHNLVQAYSRTNRICDFEKEVGYIRAYRSEMKKNTEDAFRLYSQEDDLSDILVNFEDRRDIFMKTVTELYAIARTPELVGNIKSEKGQKAFLNVFRKFRKAYKRVVYSPDFNIEKHGRMTRQALEGYESYYKVLSRTHKHPLNSASIVEDINFDKLPMVFSKDKIDTDYLLDLISNINTISLVDIKALRNQINSSDQIPLTKKDLLNKLINNLLNNDFSKEQIEFNKICEKKYNEELERISKTCQISLFTVRELIDHFNNNAGDFDYRLFARESKLPLAAKDVAKKNLTELLHETNGMQDYK